MIFYTSNNVIQTKQWNDQNLYHIANMSSSEWVKFMINRDKENGIQNPKWTFNDFWNIRDNAVQKNFNAVFNNDKFTVKDFEGILYSSGVNGMYVDEISQVQKASKSWEQWFNIKSGKSNGAVITIDTETYGDIGNMIDFSNVGKNTNGMFGITEIGVTRSTYNDGEIFFNNNTKALAGKIAGTSLDDASIVDAKVLNKGYSETIITGITKQEDEYFGTILNKWKTVGYDKLTDSERVIADRLTVYGQADIFQNGKTYGSKIFDGLFTMQSASAPTHDYGTAVLGRKNLRAVQEAYDAVGMTQADVIFKTLVGAGVLNNDGTVAANIANNTDVLVAANSRFDTAAIRNVFEASDNELYKKAGRSIVGLRDQFADITYMVRAGAAVNGQTVPEFLKSLGFKGGTATMESLLDSMGFTMEQLHIGGADTSNERFVGDRLIKALDTHTMNTLRITHGDNGTPLALQRTNDDSVFFLKNGVFNRKDAMEFASVNGKYSKSDSFSGQFYVIDKEHTGITTMSIADANGELHDVQKHVLTMTDYADINSGSKTPTQIVFTADSDEELQRRLRQYSVVYNKDTVTGQMAISQKQYHQADLARREWAKFMNPSDVEIDNGIAKNGFAGLTEMMDLLGKDGLDLPIDANTSYGAADIMRIAQEVEEKKGIKLGIDAYKAQTIAGLSGKIENERPLLEMIRSKVEEAIPMVDGAEGITNFRRTVAANNIYTRIMEQFGDPDVQKTINIFDTYGVDVRVGSEIMRVDAQTAGTATKGFDRIIKNYMMNGDYVNQSMLKNSLDDLVARGLVNQSTIDNIDFANIHQNNSYLTVSAAIARDVNINATSGSSVIKSLGDSLESARIATFDNLEFGEAFEKAFVHGNYNPALATSLAQNQSVLNDIFAKGIASAPALSMLSGNSGFDANIRAISNQLGLGDDGYNLIENMFLSKKNYGIFGRAKNGVTSAILMSDDGKSAYLALAKQGDMQKFMNAVSSGKFDLSTYGRLTNKDIAFDNAAIFELPRVREYDIGRGDKLGNNALGLGKIRTAVMGDAHEIMLTPEMNVVEGSGPRKVYLNSGIYDLMATFRQNGAKILDLVEQGEYKRASSIYNKSYLNKLMSRPGSTSVRAIMGPDGKIVRQIQFTPVDILQADMIKVGDAMETLLTDSIKTGDKDLIEVIDKYITNRGIASLIYRPKDMSDVDYFTKVVTDNRTGFKEYFNKHLFQSFSADSILDLEAGDSLYNESFYSLIKQAVTRDINGTSKVKTFDKSVLETFNKFESLFPTDKNGVPIISLADQIRSIGNYQQGYIGTGGVNSATYNINASASNNIRPTYGQMNNPIRFAVDEFNNELSVLNNGSDFTRAVAGTTMLNKNLYDATQTLMSDSEVARQVLKGTETEFLAAYKNMNDIELNERYKQLLNFSDAQIEAVAGYKMSRKRWEASVGYFKSVYDSFQEGSGMMHPDLMASTLMTSKQGATFTMPVSKLDVKATRQRLSDIIAESENGIATIRKGDIIGITSTGEAYMHSGRDMFFDQTNLDELLPEGTEIGEAYKAGKTRVALANGGDFDNVKVYVGLNEKLVARGATAEGLMKASGIKDMDTARQVLRGQFDFMFDGATIVANLDAAKHGNNLEMQSKYNIITNAFAKEGKIDQLYDFIATEYKQYDEVNGKRIPRQIFDIDGVLIYKNDIGRFMMDDSNAKNSAVFIDDLYNKLVKSGKSSGIDDRIIESIRKTKNTFRDSNMSLARVMRSNMNEFMGDFMTVNARMQQAMYMLGQGSDTFKGTMSIFKRNFEFMQILKDYSGDYNTHVANNDAFSAVVNFVSEGLNGYRVQPSNDFMKRSGRRAVNSMFDTISYYSGHAIDKELSSTIASISIDDFLNGTAVVPSGVPTAASMAGAPVYINGQRSELLQRILGENKNEDVFRLNLGTTIRHRIGENEYKEISEILLPIHDIGSMISGDEYAIMPDQKATMTFLNRVIDIKRNPNGRDVGEQIEEAYVRYIEGKGGLLSQLAKDDKKSALFKYTQSYVMPTSVQLQAESEASGLVKMLTTDEGNRTFAAEFAAAVSEEKELAKRIAEFDSTAGDMSDLTLAYAKAVTKKNDILDKVATLIEKGEYSELDINANRFVKQAMTHIDKDGKKHYGMVATMSREALEKQGLDMRSITRDIVRDYETGEMTISNSLRMYGSTEKLTAEEYTSLMLGRRVKEIKDRMNEILMDEQYDGKYRDYFIGKDDRITDTLNRLTRDVLGDGEGKDLLRAINESAVSSKEKNIMLRLYDAFEDASKNSIGLEYLEREGVYGQLYRHPTFSSQPLSRILLDRSMKGYSVKMWNPLYTSKTHVDFDGDTMFASIMLDGNSVLKLNSRGYQLYKEIYEDYVEKFSNQGVAEHIREGAFAKTHQIFNEREQKAALLNFVDPNEYNKAIEDFKKKENFKKINARLEDAIKHKDGVTRDSANAVIETLAQNSDEMEEAFDKLAINVAKDPRMLIASMAAKERNLYIGSVSTPNFRLRDAVIAMFNEAAELGDKDLQNNLAELMNDLTNTGETKGGLLTIAEQKIIDTKKAIDALSISEVSLYTMGMSGLRNAGKAKDYAEAVGGAVRAIIRGSGPNIYSFLRDENAKEVLNALQGLAANNTPEEIKRLAEEISKNGSAKGAILRNLNSTERTVLKSYEFSSDLLPVINDVKSYRLLADAFSDSRLSGVVDVLNLLDKNSAIGSLSEYMDKIYTLMSDRPEKFTGNMFYEIAELGIDRIEARNAAKAAAEKFTINDIQDNMVYFSPGMYDTNEEWFMAIARDNDGNISRLRMDNGEFYREPVELSAERLRHLTEVEPVQLARFQTSKELRDIKYREISQKETQHALDTMVDKLLNGEEIPQSFSGRESYKSRIAGAYEIIGDADAKSIRELADAYDAIVYERPLSLIGGNGESSSKELIRGLNEYIAKNGRVDKDGNPMSYADLMRARMKSNLSLSNADYIIDETVARSKASGGNIGDIAKTIEHLRNNVYNVSAEESVLNDVYDRLQESVDMMSKTPKVKQQSVDALKEMLNKREETIKEVLGKLDQSNIDAVKNAESTVYGFVSKGEGTFAENLDVIFGLNKSEGDSMVGFGRLMGVQFKDLRKDDIQAILDMSLDNLDEQTLQAVQATQDSLKKYVDNKKPFVMNGTVLRNIGSEDVKKVASELDEKIDDILSKSSLTDEERMNIFGAKDRAARDAAKRAQKMARKEMKDKVINAKTVGIVVGALAAIGLANKIIHGGDSSGSPLVPERSQGSQQGDEPSYDPFYGKQPGGMSGKFTGDNNIYVDNKSNIKFKVNAKTKSKMMAMNAAMVPAQYGNGGGNLNIRADNSNVSSNWLANRFAELAE